MNILLQHATYVHKATHIYNNNFPLHFKFILAELMISQDNSYLKLVQTAQPPQSKKATAVFSIWQHLLGTCLPFHELSEKFEDDVAPLESIPYASMEGWNGRWQTGAAYIVSVFSDLRIAKSQLGQSAVS